MRIDWLPTYLAAIEPVVYRPLEVVKWQGATGFCFAESTCYAMELRAILQGYPPRQLSPAYNGWTDGSHNDRGTSAGGALGGAQWYGVCRESLWPMLPYAGVDPTTHEYDLATKALLVSPPSPEAVADAPNQVITDWGLFQYQGVTDMKAKATAAIAAGYPLIVITPSWSHVQCAFGVDDDGLSGLDSRSQNRSPFHMNWNAIGGIAAIVRSVRFANATAGPPLTVPPVSRNSQMLDDIINIAQTAKSAGSKVTAAQRDALIANATALVPDTGTAGSPPPPVTTANLVHDIGPGEGFMSSRGDAWSIDATTKAIKRNGQGAAGLYVKRAIEDSTGAIKALRTNDSWQIWTGRGDWNQTSAP